MHRITVVTLGPGSTDHLTLGGIEALRRARRRVLRTGRHGAAQWLEAQGLAYETLDGLYEQSRDFDQFAALAAQRLLALSEEGPLCYGVADPGADEPLNRLLAQAGERVRTLAGVTLPAPLLAARPLPPPILVTDATSLSVLDGQRPVCLTELNSRALAGECKLKLLACFDADSALYFFPPGEGGTRRAVATTLEELDRQRRYDHTAGALVLPRAAWQKARYDIHDLRRLMRRLRAQDGCPWDRAQTHQSLARYLQEEANEAVHAISQGDGEALCDELGDVLLQVVFHAAIGEETGAFGFEDICTAICAKLIRRHRHIFGGEKLDTAEQVAASWEQVKARERGDMSAGEKMRALPASLPPMLRAVKAQEMARKVGFDWEDPRDALKKVHEEAGELLRDYEAGRDVRDELGDLFFAALNTARLMGAYPDDVVNRATEKFIERFNRMESYIISAQKAGKCLTLDEWGVYWDRSKQAE